LNRKVLQKVIDAIKANKIEYAMGILDTLMESLPEENKAQVELKKAMNNVFYGPQDEASILNSQASARLKNVDLKSIEIQ
jgi:hypothetical protein